MEKTLRLLYSLTVALFLANLAYAGYVVYRIDEIKKDAQELAGESNKLKKIFKTTLHLSEAKARLKRSFERMGLIDDSGLPGGLPQWVDPSLWSELDKGVTQDKVISLLGDPDQMNGDMNEFGTIVYVVHVKNIGKIQGLIHFFEGKAVIVKPPPISIENLKEIYKEK